MLFEASASLHTVIISVFEGGEGWISGGKSERSSESGDFVPDDARERCGDSGSELIISPFVSVCKISRSSRITTVFVSGKLVCGKNSRAAFTVLCMSGVWFAYDRSLPQPSKLLRHLRQALSTNNRRRKTRLPCLHRPFRAHSGPLGLHCPCEQRLSTKVAHGARRNARRVMGVTDQRCGDDRWAGARSASQDRSISPQFLNAQSVICLFGRESIDESYCAVYLRPACPSWILEPIASSF